MCILYMLQKIIVLHAMPVCSYMSWILWFEIILILVTDP